MRNHIKTIPVLAELITRKRYFNDDGPDGIAADLGAGKLQLNSRTGACTVDLDIFEHSQADEERPQLLKGGRLIFMCDDIGTSQLVAKKRGKSATIAFPNLDVKDYCVGSNGEEIFCLDKKGRLFYAKDTSSPVERWLPEREGLAALCLSPDRESLRICSYGERRWKFEDLCLKKKTITSLAELPFRGLRGRVHMSPSGRSAFLQDGGITRVDLETGEHESRDWGGIECDHTRFHLAELFSGYEVSNRGHACGRILRAVLDDDLIVLSEDRADYGEHDEEGEWPYWSRKVWVADFTEQRGYFISRDDTEYLNFHRMNGRGGGWSRYHRKFDSKPELAA